jgi:K+-transporting ATPase ATPase C chain
MLKEMRACFLLFLSLSILTGVFYPVMITGIAQIVFRDQANGSLIRKSGTVVGSKLIGQQFDKPEYFWGRLSATVPAYNASASTGSNLGPLNPKRMDAIRARCKQLQDAEPGNQLPIPVDLVTSSASGLDPHISIAAANYQKNRVARARGLSTAAIDALIRENTEHRFLGLIGEPVVNVLNLNLALDGKKQ